HSSSSCAFTAECATVAALKDTSGVDCQLGGGPVRDDRALSSIACGYIFLYASIGLLVPLASPALTAVGFATATVGGLWAVRACSALLSPVLWGLLADRSRHRQLAPGMSLCAGGMMLASLGGLNGTSPHWLSVLAFLGSGLVGAASASLLDGLTLARLEGARHRYGGIRLFGALGFGIAAYTASEAAANGWLVVKASTIFPLAGALQVLAAVFVVVVPATAMAPATARPPLLTVLRQPGLRSLALLGILHWSSHGAYHTFLMRLGELRGVGERAVGLALTTAILSEVLVLRVSAPLLARWSREQLLLFVYAITTIRWAGLASSTGLLSFVCLQLLHGASFALFHATAVTLVADRAPETSRQSLQGLFASLVYGLGTALGAYVAGMCLERGSGETGTWGAMTGLAAIPLVVTAARRCRRQRSRAR
ncbi:MAG: MFS transporter, partial [Myxococcota bacterium]